MADLGGSNLRNGRRVTARRALCVLAGLGLCSAVACSDGTDVTYQVNGNAVAPASPSEGVLSGCPVPPGAPLVSPPSGEVSAPSVQASGAGAPPPTQEHPPPVQAPPAQEPSASGGEPQPNATETNFFGAGCRSDADCGANRRCEFPADAEADAAPNPAPEVSPDAGADAAVPETLVPRGHCVAR
jgi:hypothetical protein